MNKIWSRGALVLAVGFLLALTTGAQNNGRTERVHGHDAVANEVLIKFHDASLQDIEDAKVRGGIVHARKVGGTGAYRFRSVNKNVNSLIELFAEDPLVEYVEPNYVFYADDTIPGDPLWGDLWGMRMIQAPFAWDLKTDSSLVTVGVVDTGVDDTHPDLAANIWSAPFAFTVEIGGAIKTCPAGAHGYNAIRGTFTPKDDNDHGTHVSGTIGAFGNNVPDPIGVVGVGWRASIMALKFLNSRGSGDTADAVDAIEFAIQAKQAGAANVQVLSNSWGGGNSTRTMLDEIRKANDNDILFVCSAGNNGGEMLKNRYPCTYSVPNLIAVAASDPFDNRASFSNTGKWSVHLAAPGTDILSTVPGSAYAVFSGTSMSAPHVSGVAALTAANLGGAVSAEELRSILMSSVDANPSSDLYEKLISGGRLNAFKALTTLPASQDPYFDWFEDFSLYFTGTGTAKIKRGGTAYFDLEITSHHGYEDDLLVEKECCTWSSITGWEFALLDEEKSPGPYLTSLPVHLGAGETKTVRMKITTSPSATVMQYRLTVHAYDPEDAASGEPGPFLYHNETAYLDVVRR